MENPEKEKIWWVIRGEQREGPYTRDQLKARAAAGKVRAEDQLWKEGLTRPLLAASVRGLIADPTATDPYAAPLVSAPAEGPATPWWRRTLMIGGAVFFVLLLVIGATVAVLVHKGSQLDDSARAYVDTEVPVIFGQWNADELVAQATPEFLRVTNRAQARDMMQQVASKMGDFRSYDGASGQALMSATTQNGQQVSASFQARLSYAAGPATVDLQLVQQYGYWRIRSFHFNSPLLTK